MKLRWQILALMLALVASCTVRLVSFQVPPVVTAGGVFEVVFKYQAAG